MRFLAAAVVCMLLSAPPAAAQTAWKPERAVELVVVSAPGGGNDKLGRFLQRIWQENRWVENAQVVNKVGGGGTVAYNYTNQRPGDAHTLAIARMGLLSKSHSRPEPTQLHGPDAAGGHEHRGDVLCRSR